MTEIERDSQSTENATDPVKSPLDRVLWWLAAIAFFFAACYVLGLYFGFVEYRILAAQPVGAKYRAEAMRVVLIHMVKSAMLVAALAHLGRVLVRYRNSLKGEIHPHVAFLTLTARQLSCWQALLWVAFLKAGWELTSVIASSW